jgi:hypothetical protein
MERARVAGDGEGYAPGDGDQLAKRAVEGRGRTGSGLSDGVGEGLFAGPDIDYDAVAAGDKVNRDGCITLCGPTLCAPSRSRIDEDGGTPGGQELGGPGFGYRVSRKQGGHGREIVSGDGGSELKILLDNMDAARSDSLRIEEAGDELAGAGLAHDATAAGHAGDPAGANRALKVDDSVVAGGAEIAPQSLYFMDSMAAQRRFAPLLGRGQMNAVDEG